MALGALKSHAEEKLCRVFELRIGIVDLPIPGHRRILTEVAGRSHDLARELVVGSVPQQAGANPIVERVRAARVGWRAPLVAQQRAPLVREVIRVIGAVEQGVNPLLAFGRIFVRKKLSGFF